MYKRAIEPRIVSDLHHGKVIIIYGARQVGKTTLAKKILAEHGAGGLYFDCQVRTVHDFLVPDPDVVKARIGDARMVIFDEAQYVPDIGRTLKVFHDRYPEVQIIATGSSSFDLARKTAESMAGRTREYILYPLSVAEVIGTIGRAAFDERYEIFLRYGFYPGIIGAPEDKKTADLESLQANALYKDILALEGVRKPQVLVDLLKLLALRTGSEVSAHSLANHLNTSLVTISKYLDILEKMFIITRLRAFSRNPGKEIRKGYKVYFLDIGMRNSILQNHNPMDIRQDVGALFENYFIVERIKRLSNEGVAASHYFWRTTDQKEIDLIEDRDGALYGYECKWSDGSVALAARRFGELYPGSSIEVVTKASATGLLA
ncbi:ATP-binding protein [Candidatus Kaiserbacteria bacterium]|nr:ATP-binding protein [Candidatus Kaiserbacteria bacterium]